MKAKKNCLTVVEVPVDVKYKELERSSTQNPLEHGASILMSIIRLIVEEKPLMLLGLPGMIFLFGGTIFEYGCLKYSQKSSES